VKSLVQSPGFTSDSVGDRGTHAVHTGLRPFFASPPPERVGLNGEYDYNGLTKRVDRALRQSFSQQALEQLKIAQRGRVVVLTGRVPDASLLCQLSNVAASVSGATTVETRGIQLINRSHDQ
jgi:osmotically-inducible protein OsmY